MQAPSISHISHGMTHGDPKRQLGATEPETKGCYQRYCPGVIATKIEICMLLKRLEKAENDLLNVTRIIQSSTKLDNFNDKLAAMTPYPHYSEGEEVRQMLWDMEKRISILESYYNTEFIKGLIPQVPMMPKESDTESDVPEQTEAVESEEPKPKKKEENLKLGSVRSRPPSVSGKHSSVGSRPSSATNKLQSMSSKPPSDDNKPPSDGNKPPSDSNKPPSDGNKPPSDSNKPPSDSNKPPSDSNKPPSVSSKPPSFSTKAGSIGSKTGSVLGNTSPAKNPLAKGKSAVESVVERTLSIISSGKRLSEARCSFKLDNEKDLMEGRKSAESEPKRRSSRSLERRVYISQTDKLLGGDQTVRKVVHQMREQILDAREQFGQTRSTLYKLSKLLIHVRDTVPLDSLCNCTKELGEVKGALNALTGGQYESGGVVDFVHNKRLLHSEDSIVDFDARLRKLGNIGLRMERLDRHVTELDNNLSILFGRLDAGLPLRSGINDNPTKITKLFNTIRVLEQTVKDVSKVPPQLKESEIQRDAAVDAIEEYVELLLIIKLDKVDLEEAIFEKVPAEDVDRKVDRNDLFSKEHAFKHVINHNSQLFKERDKERVKMANSIRNLLKSKIGIKTLERFEKFLSKKFKKVIDELEMTPPPKNKVVAAGTRRDLSHQPLCCKCAARLRCEAPPPPPRGGVTPYHAYEMRQLEEQQKRWFAHYNTDPACEKIPSSDAAFRTKRTLRQNRLCGGKHTTTTPQQRLIRRIPCEEIPTCHYEEILYRERKKLEKFIRKELEGKLDKALLRSELKDELERRLKEELGENGSIDDEMRKMLGEGLDEKMSEEEEHEFENELKHHIENELSKRLGKDVDDNDHDEHPEEGIQQILLEKLDEHFQDREED